MEISAVAGNYFQILPCKKGKLFAGEHSWGSDDGGKGQEDKKESFHIPFSSCHMKEMPAVTLSECEQGDVCKLPKSPSVGRRERRKLSLNKTIRELQPFPVIFVIQSWVKRNKSCPSSVGYQDALIGDVQMSQVLLVRGNSTWLLVICREYLTATRRNQSQ